MSLEKTDDIQMNSNKNLQVVSLSDPEELQKFINGLQGYVEIKAIYGLGGRHFAWIDTNLKLKKKLSKQEK